MARQEQHHGHGYAITVVAFWMGSPSHPSLPSEARPCTGEHVLRPLPLQKKKKQQHGQTHLIGELLSTLMILLHWRAGFLPTPILLRHRFRAILLQAHITFIGSYWCWSAAHLSHYSWVAIFFPFHFSHRFLLTRRRRVLSPLSPPQRVLLVMAP